MYASTEASDSVFHARVPCLHESLSTAASLFMYVRARAPCLARATRASAAVGGWQIVRALSGWRWSSQPLVENRHLKRTTHRCVPSETSGGLGANTQQLNWRDVSTPHGIKSCCRLLARCAGSDLEVAARAPASLVWRTSVRLLSDRNFAAAPDNTTNRVPQEHGAPPLSSLFGRNSRIFNKPRALSQCVDRAAE